MSLVIGLDLGTTGCKANIFNEKGEILGESYIEYTLKVHSDSEIEQDPDDWWNLTKKVMIDAIKQVGSDKIEIGAISISSQGISFVPVDEKCNPLFNAISWLDTRAEVEIQDILSQMDESYIYKVTGKRVNSAYVLPKILWIKKNMQEVYNKTFKFLMAHDYIIAKLSGMFMTDHTMAAGTLMYDINSLMWSDEIIEELNIDKNKLPEIKWSGEIAGKIKREVAEELQLSKDVIICIGAQDQKAAAIGARLQIGSATLSLGTAGAMEFLTERPVFDRDKRIPCFTYSKRNTWVLEAVIATTGAALKWFRNTIFPSHSYQELDSMCMSSQIGANGIFFYPHLTGATSPIWNSEARGCFYGLSLNASQKDIVRSVLEGIAFQLKSNVIAAEEMGVEVKSIIMFGGGSKSAVWREIIANATGKTVLAYDSPEIASLGAASLAAMGLGLYNENFGYKMLEKSTTYIVNEQANKEYETIYKKYINFEKNFI